MITIDIESIDTSERMQDEIVHLLDASVLKPEPVIKGLAEFYNILLKEQSSGIAATGVPEPDYTNFTPEADKGAGDDYPVIEQDGLDNGENSDRYIPQTEVDPSFTVAQLREKLREAHKEIARMKAVSPPPQAESQE